MDSYADTQQIFGTIHPKNDKKSGVRKNKNKNKK